MKMTVNWMIDTSNILHMDCDQRQRPGMMIPMGVYGDWDAVVMCIDCNRYTLFIGTDNKPTQTLPVITPQQRGRVDGDDDND